MITTFVGWKSHSALGGNHAPYWGTHKLYNPTSLNASYNLTFLNTCYNPISPILGTILNHSILATIPLPPNHCYNPIFLITFTMQYATSLNHIYRNCHLCLCTITPTPPSNNCYNLCHNLAWVSSSQDLITEKSQSYFTKLFPSPIWQSIFLTTWSATTSLLVLFRNVTRGPSHGILSFYNHSFMLQIEKHIHKWKRNHYRISYLYVFFFW